MDVNYFAPIALTAMTFLSVARDWLKRRDVDFLEFDQLPQPRIACWGTCWPESYGRARKDWPAATFRYVLVALPSWSWENVDYGHRSGKHRWCRDYLFKFGAEPWRVIKLTCD